MAKGADRPKSFVDAVMRGIAEVDDSLRGGRPLTVREVRVVIKPRQYKAREVRATREALGVSQAIFAQFLGTSLNTIRSWERGARHPSPMARRFLDEINTSPEHWRGRLANSVAQR